MSDARWRQAGAFKQMHPNRSVCSTHLIYFFTWIATNRRIWLAAPLAPLMDPKPPQRLPINVGRRRQTVNFPRVHLSCGKLVEKKINFRKQFYFRKNKLQVKSHYRICFIDPNVHLYRKNFPPNRTVVYCSSHTWCCDTGCCSAPWYNW